MISNNNYINSGSLLRCVCRYLLAMYNKTIIRFGFCDVQNNQGLGKCDHPRPSARLITLSSTLIIPDITKTSSNICLLSRVWKIDIMNVRKGFRVLTSDHFRDFGFFFEQFWFSFLMAWKRKPAIFFLFFFIIVVCEHEQPEELGNTINLFYFQLTLLQSIYWEWYWVRVHWELMKILYIQTFQSHVDKFFEAAINLFLAACYNIVPICLWY